ncbi:MAG TPA: Fur family transcriptional regulator [Anaerolineales bacterium]|nr:Fur family transcriptional regulator [Anaerolineales bacterium]
MSTIHNADVLLRSLHAKGLRLTPQRKLVLRILQQSSEHLDAEGIWQRARRECQDLNLATVYRTLNLLAGIGLIQQSYLGEGQKRGYYEVLDKPEHYHFACLRCGRVMELSSDHLQQAQKELEECNGVRIINVHVKFEGLCPDCKTESSANA